MMCNGVRVAAVAVLAVAALGGCQSARYVVRESDHGVIAVPTGSERYRREAEQLMREHFPDGYTIVREEPVLLEDTPHTLQQIRSQFDATDSRRMAAGPAAASSGPNGPRSEWRITYFRDQPASPQAIADAPLGEFEPGESLFSTAGMIEPAATSN